LPFQSVASFVRRRSVAVEGAGDAVAVVVLSVQDAVGEEVANADVVEEGVGNAIAIRPASLHKNA